ncbi:hypothetical protein N0V85_008777 [Neurospora sp. IMI 360204]|nr:hypothetical protein N0V85_008777 [Neurospora sp. IMI 360204]
MVQALCRYVWYRRERLRQTEVYGYSDTDEEDEDEGMHFERTLEFEAALLNDTFDAYDLAFADAGGQVFTYIQPYHAAMSETTDLGVGFRPSIGQALRDSETVQIIPGRYSLVEDALASMGKPLATCLAASQARGARSANRRSRKRRSRGQQRGPRRLALSLVIIAKLNDKLRLAKLKKEDPEGYEAHKAKENARYQENRDQYNANRREKGKERIAKRKAMSSPLPSHLTVANLVGPFATVFLQKAAAFLLWFGVFLFNWAWVCKNEEPENHEELVAHQRLQAKEKREADPEKDEEFLAQQRQKYKEQNEDLQAKARLKYKKQKEANPE